MKIRWLYGFAVALVALGGYGLEREYNERTQGFGPSAIATNFLYEESWEIPSLSSDQRESLNAILSQRFTYLGKGTQSYVLESEDHRYVIKFFKGKHLYFYDWLKPMVSLPLVGRLLEEDWQRREAKRNKIYNGCKLAYLEMSVDSGVEFVHLNPSEDLPNQIVIVDAIGREHILNPNDIPFYLQRKGASFRSTLSELKQKNDLEGAQALITDLFAYLVERSQRGIYDRDNNSMANLGCLDGHVATLDVGNLSKDPEVTIPAEYCRRIVRHTLGVEQWLATYWPELLPEYHAQVAVLQAASS